MTHPEFTPVAPDRWSRKTRSLIVDGRDRSRYDNPLFLILAHHEPLLRAWYRFTGRLVTRTSLTDREREMLTLRISWRTGTPLQWGEHVEAGLRAGLSREEIASLAGEEISAGWSRRERMLIEAADQLWGAGRIGGDLLARLADHFTAKEVLEVMFIAGNAAMIAAVINTLGIAGGFEGLRNLTTLPPSGPVAAGRIEPTGAALDPSGSDPSGSRSGRTTPTA
ncbi:carboxymuconolactone decarboxylase family protein [Actinomadura madurae]|uniref:carboxymuconolactone decarboxylase family protein n=1 Tax=Actinomadura madurae TaxID=1993 RepID=UPI0020272B78|nr:carboxymuconolactone decarboxylase family protein [Actinomadura madurae]MCP9950973.1 carboxymuconolactone decarboxylase family protein [Actinomadura madurae]MCP9967758.1 carboxymuconolactone decarboxylase family protein [Actinomadura madurae]MCP9980208.1 carboxymuconolactone decarboxylase family protein [Actinomadura madurae]MCQ0008268.1 carboxymuconolactone decarboxylase family protein [Actinomadura madurae]MCQ0016419.1 carboxymuconolactone decarboxylase family protein [Actinomadura madura